MKLAALLLAPMSAILAASILSTGTATDAPLWHSDYQEAKALAKQTGKPLFVTFR